MAVELHRLVTTSTQQMMQRTRVSASIAVLLLRVVDVAKYRTHAQRSLLLDHSRPRADSYS